MKMQDAEKTWDLIRDQAGQSTILRTTGYTINEQISFGYRDTMSTTVEKEDRVDLRDLQEQIEGEAHFIFSGQVVRGRCVLCQSFFEESATAGAAVAATQSGGFL